MNRFQTILISVITFHFSLFAFHSFAQQGQWTWMNGSNTPNSAGVYGTQGVFALGNTPPALYEACEWTDKEGNFWLFGGLNSNNNGNIYNDLWEFKSSINEWAWIKGPGIPNQPGIYGTYQVPSILNNPSPRSYGAPTWIDTTGDLWVFGGASIFYGVLNDLWKYNIATNEWTWMAGSNIANDPGNYGTILFPAVTNNPPCRSETNASWTDNNDNLWLFGGFGIGADYSDMWMFNTSLLEWVWMKGPNIGNQPSIYGIVGIPDPANTPDSRWCYAKWKDSRGNFWFFGGLDDSLSGSFRNDLWRFNPITYEWTWIKGPNIGNDTGNLGTQCISALTSNPRSKAENRACWTRKCDNFVNFGGIPGGNNLWNYSVSTNEWTLMSGNDTGSIYGNYGVILVSSSTNEPSNRQGSIGWSDNVGNLWMFGGIEYSGFLNDMWRFVPDSTCPYQTGNDINVTSTFTSSPLNGCAPATVTFTNSSINATSCLWNFGDTFTSTSSSPTHAYTAPGTYTVTLISYNTAPCGIATDTSTTTITVGTSAQASFTATDTVGCSPLNVNFINTSTNANSYLWSFGNNVTSNVTNPSFYYDSSGIYTITLIAYGAGGCNDTITRSNYISIDTLRTPISSFTVIPVSGCTPLSVSFTNNSVNGTSYYWDFGDTFTDTTTNPTHIYTAGGRDTVKLITTYTSACGSRSDTSTTIITVNITPAASFTADTLTGCSPLTVTFNNSSSNATSYLWNFGNTATSIATNPSYNYDSSGIYTVTLIAYGTGGCTDTMVRQNLITILGLPVISGSFTADTVIGCSPLTVHFINTSGSDSSYLWNFGDGSTDTAKNPTHTFLDSGKFTITLIITSTNDCGTTTDTITYTDYISVNQFNPVAAFTSNYVTPIYTGDSIHFQDESYDLYGSISLWQWWFGDGTGTNFINPIHEWNLPGMYQLELIVTDNKGCKDSAIYDYIDVIEGIIEIPNIFSPNNDGYNDFFEIKASGLATFQLDIFNRWGMKLFTSNSINISWDGYNENGLQCPDGTYYYVLKATGYTGTAYNRAGYVMLIR